MGNSGKRRRCIRSDYEKREIFQLYPRVANYVLVGDATGIPVLRVIVNDLHEQAQGICVVEVHGKEDEILIETRSKVKIVWPQQNNPY